MKSPPHEAAMFEIKLTCYPIVCCGTALLAGSLVIGTPHTPHLTSHATNAGAYGAARITYKRTPLPRERGSGLWPPPNSKENPDSQKSSLIKLLILK